MIDLETRIRNELMKPQHTSDNLMVEGMTEIAAKVHELNVVMNEEIHKLNQNTKSLLLEHLELVEKTNASYHEQLVEQQFLMQELLSALLVDVDLHPEVSQSAWKNLRVSALKYLESRKSN